MKWDPNEMVSREQLGQLPQIEEDDCVRHNIDQFCVRACNNVQTHDTLFLACEGNCDHHAEE